MGGGGGGGGRGGGRGGRLREKEEEPRRRGPDLPVGCQETGKEEEVNGTEAAYARTDHVGAATKDTRGHPGAHKRLCSRRENNTFKLI